VENERTPGRKAGGNACFLAVAAIDRRSGQTARAWYQIRRCDRMLSVILFGPGEVLVLLVITVVVVLLAVRGRRAR